MATQLCEGDSPADAPGDAGHTDSPLPERRRRRGVSPLAAGLCAAALAALVFLGWQYQRHAVVADASRAALAAAQDYAVTLTSITAGSVDDNFAKVIDGATGEFKDMYGQSATQLRQMLIDNKAMSKGVVVDSAVKSATKDRVEVLLFVDQSITNVANPVPRLDRSRVALTMELADGRWLASRVELK
jgi:Mce-associated membrane protein